MYIKIILSIALTSVAVLGKEDTTALRGRALGKLDCSLVKCLAPSCGEGEGYFTPPGQCCPRCNPSRTNCGGGT
eukprot:5483590-Ditylum_brightwellii.AAC.1